MLSMLIAPQMVCPASGGATLTKNVFRIEVDFVTVQQAYEFIFERHLPVMSCLIVDIAHNGVNI